MDFSYVIIDIGLDTNFIYIAY